MTYKLYQAFSCFSRYFKGHICDQENGAGDSSICMLPVLLELLTLRLRSCNKFEPFVDLVCGMPYNTVIKTFLGWN